MSLDRHIRVLWRYRAVTLGGVVLALALAFLAAFNVSGNGLERRGTETWSSSSRILVTQRGFPWGRVTLPAAADPNQALAPTTPSQDNRQEYADPTRFVNLAMLYSVISYSDQVRSKLPGNVSSGQIEALPLDATGGGDILPVITLTTTSSSPSNATELNRLTFEGLKDLLVAEQEKASIPVKERVVLEPLNEPSAPLLVSGRAPTASVLALILALGMTLALVHVLEAIRLARMRRLAALEIQYAATANGHFEPPLAADVPVRATASTDR
jgi:hypothetical protein